MRTKDIVLDVLFPRFCLGCGREGRYVCDKCNVFISEVEPLHQCGTGQALYQNKFGAGQALYQNKYGAGQAHYFKQEKYGLDALISIWEYEGLIKKLIHEIKYQGLTDIIKELISLINIEIYYPYITYVPMYLKREKRRGFNQAKLIAEELAKKTFAKGGPASGWNCQVVSLLEKIKDTKPQMELTQEERLENIKDSFIVNADLSGIGQVLLVDDVFTTGATMRECTKVLKKAGVKKVWGFVLSRTA